MTKKLGQILVKEQLITNAQLEQALEEQKRVEGERLGSVLVRLGFANEKAILDCLNIQSSQIPGKKKLCVAMPALNEEATIVQVIQRIPKEIPQIDHIDIVVVNDGSTDRTEELATGAGAIVVNHSENFGVGIAFHTAVDQAVALEADIMVTIDADGQFAPEDIPKLVEPIVKNHADFVTASRFKDKTFYPDMSTTKFYGNHFMAGLISWLTGKKYYDVSCGFRAYSREALLRLNLFGGFTYTQETFLEFAFKGMSIVEIPLKIRGTREYGKSRVASNLFRYSYQTSKIILKTFRDYKPLRLFFAIAFLMFVFACGFGGFLLFHYVRIGKFTPHKWAGFVSGAFIFSSAAVMALGFIVDMFSRMRQNQEEMLYMLKKYLSTSEEKPIDGK